MDVRFAWFVFALVALIATISVTEVVRVFALRLRAVDQPGGRRVHRAPTARLGGLGIFWGFAVAMALATYGHTPWAGHLPPGGEGLIGMLAGAALLLVVGVRDDVRGVPATLKLGIQICAALLLFAFGWRVETLGIPGVGAWTVGAWSLPLTVAWVVLVTNALNLIDGLDGLACGVGLVATLAASWLLVASGMPSLLVAAALAGALGGFLWFNLHPALIFMGDTGSLFVGFTLSAVTLRAAQVASPEAFPLVPALLLAVPLLDTLDAIRRRTVLAWCATRTPLAFVLEARRRVFAPDGLHLHHRLLRLGIGTRRAVVMLWGTAALFAIAGCVMLTSPLAGAVAACALAAGARLALATIDVRLARSPVPVLTTIAELPAAVRPVAPVLLAEPEPVEQTSQAA